jgi:hypothetical protein
MVAVVLSVYAKFDYNGSMKFERQRGNQPATDKYDLTNQ